MKNVVEKPIYSITPFTALDYPDHTACIVWFSGCNMKCQYCYNPAIVFGEGKHSFEEVYQFLKTRVGLLDAVVLSGGEAGRCKELVRFIREIRKIGMKIKLDTNGSNPALIQRLLDFKLVDYIALDFKALRHNYFTITKSKLFDRFERSLDILIKSKIHFEVRTTIHDQLFNRSDIQEMVNYLENKGYNGNYFLQNFRNETETIEKLEYSTNSLLKLQYQAENTRIQIR